MEYLHSLGIVYRDLKASNLVVDKKGHLKLIDYGLSKFIYKERFEKKMTTNAKFFVYFNYLNEPRTKTVCGTLHSMAPEMWEEKEYGYEVDFFGFGILIYELLFG